MHAIPQDLLLENESVLLRRLTQADVEYLIHFAMNEPGLWRFSLTSAAGETGMKQYIQTAVKGFEEGHSFPFLVYDKTKQQYAGSTRFYDIQSTHSTVQVGYTFYGKAFQGTGLNKHCKYLLLQFAFEQLGAERVEFRADNNNARSIAAMKSIGCKVEGVLRSSVIKANGARRDSIILSILKDEWETEVKKNLLAKL